MEQTQRQEEYSRQQRERDEEWERFNRQRELEQTQREEEYSRQQEERRRYFEAREAARRAKEGDYPYTSPARLLPRGEDGVLDAWRVEDRVAVRLPLDLGGSVVFSMPMDTASALLSAVKSPKEREWGQLFDDQGNHDWRFSEGGGAERSGGRLRYWTVYRCRNCGETRSNVEWDQV